MFLGLGYGPNELELSVDVSRAHLAMDLASGEPGLDLCKFGHALRESL